MEEKRRAKLNYMSINRAEHLKQLIIDTLDSLDQDFLALLRYRRIIIKLLDQAKKDADAKPVEEADVSEDS